MTKEEQKRELASYLGVKKITTDIFRKEMDEEEDENYVIRYSKIHQKASNYWFTLNEDNLKSYEEYEITEFIFFGPAGYYVVPSDIIGKFIEGFTERPKDGKYHIIISLESHYLKSNEKNSFDITPYFNELPKVLKDFYEMYIVKDPLAIRFHSFKTKETSINDVSPDGAEFEFGGIYQNEAVTNLGDIVFFNQHGENPKWDVGLSAICVITEGPHDKGYNTSARRQFKIKLQPLVFLPKVLSRAEFIGYFNSYDIPYIGPMVKNEQNQANGSMTIDQAKNLVGILIDIFPEFEEELTTIFGEDFPILNLKATVKDIKDLGEISQNELINNPISDEHPKNLILYGAPGTGKSYEMSKRAKELFPNEYLYKRVTFHSSYSYRNFVGSYKPKPLYKKTEVIIFDADKVTLNEHKMEPVIEYAFEPGPFLILYERAIKNPNNNFLLLIEELNRANTSAVFGDLFQLLDRTNSGESEYPINLECSINDYLKSKSISDTEIKIPANLYIWATMNNADQGVLPLDTAFKRRWSFEHLGINANEKELDEININLPFDFGGKELKWNTFRKIINTKLLELGVHEDKLIGPFFLSKNEIINVHLVKNKLLLYLKEDVLRYKTGVFKSSLKTFSAIAEEYDKGVNVFDETSISFFE